MKLIDLLVSNLLNSKKKIFFKTNKVTFNRVFILLNRTSEIGEHIQDLKIVKLQ